MAKIVKDTRETIDIDTELENIKNSNKKIGNQGKKKDEKIDKKAKKPAKKKNMKKGKKQNGIVKFLKEVKNEVAKVKWPSKKDMVKYSIATIAFVLFFAIFFYLIDLVVAILKEVI